MSRSTSGADPAAPSPWPEVAERSGMPVVLVALATRRVVARSKAAEALVGPIEWAYDLSPDREQSRKRLDLLENGVINGYRFTSTLTTPSGSPLQLEIDVQRLNDAEGRDLALVLLAAGDATHEAEGADPLVALRATSSQAELNAPLLVGTVDRDWRIARLSSDIKDVLGYDPTTFIGTPFTHWVHPADVGNLLIGIGQALEGDATAPPLTEASTELTDVTRRFRSMKPSPTEDAEATYSKMESNSARSASVFPVVGSPEKCGS